RAFCRPRCDPAGKGLSWKRRGPGVGVRLGGTLRPPSWPRRGSLLSLRHSSRQFLLAEVQPFDKFGPDAEDGQAGGGPEVNALEDGGSVKASLGELAPAQRAEDKGAKQHPAARVTQGDVRIGGRAVRGVKG